MKYKLAAALVLCCVFVACNNNKRILTKYFNPANLPEQDFNINVQRDTAVITRQGIKIHIPANAIDAGGSNATLIVKEALNIEDMLRGGLTTKSGNELLSSEGMFYINTKENAFIKKQLSVFLPTTTVDNRMELYQGIESNSKIDWQNPQKMDSAVTNVTDSGATLFKLYCSSCHAADKVLTGPPLAWEDKRKNMQWLLDYTRSNSKMIEKGDKYACCMMKQYASAMTDFDSLLNNRQITAIYKYIDKISRQMNLPLPVPGYLSFCDSCAYFNNYYTKLLQAKGALKWNAQITGIVVSTAPLTETPAAEKNVEYNPAIHEYYQFDIKVFGWFNIDALTHQYCDTNNILKVKIDNPPTKRFEVFLAVPEMKIFAEGGLLDDKAGYGFDKANGEISLPLNSKAIVFAIGEDSGRMYFGQIPFVSVALQNITVKISPSSKQQIDNFFKSINALPVSASKIVQPVNPGTFDREIDKARKILQKCSCNFDFHD